MANNDSDDYGDVKSSANGAGVTALEPQSAEIVQQGKMIQGLRTPHQAIVLARTPRSERMDIIRQQIAEEAAELGEKGVYNWEVKSKDGPKEVVGMNIRVSFFD